MFKVVVFVPETHADRVRQAMGDAGTGIIGNYSHCSFSSKGVGRFRPLKGANPAIGKVGEAEEVVEERIECVVSQENLGEVLTALKKSHPYEEPAYDIYHLEDSSLGLSVQKIESPHAPKAAGAYSQALSVDLEKTKNLVFVCGEVPIDPKTGQMVDKDIQSATNQTLDNIEAILKAGGSDWKYVVRMDVFLLHFDRDWDGMNEVYAKRFPGGVYPVRQTVGVKMDDNTLVEISCIATVPKTK